MSLIVIIISITSPSLSSASSPASSPSSSIALRMIFGICRSYFISWQIFENKVWCPVSKKRRRYFHFLLSLAYPIYRLDWALFSVVILFHHWFPLLEKLDNQTFILPHNFLAVSIIFAGRSGEHPPPHSAGWDGVPPSPRRAGRSSLQKTFFAFLWKFPVPEVIFVNFLQIYSAIFW